MIIGITTTLNESDGFQRVNVEYIKRIAETGATPILITPIEGDAKRNAQLAEEVIELVDGILFTGGGDIHPKHYMDVTMNHIHEMMHPESISPDDTNRPYRAADYNSDCMHCPVDDALRNAVDNVDAEQFTAVLDGRDVVASTDTNTIPCLDGLLAVWDARDGLELELARLAHERKIPSLGVCRGMQVMNVALGGSLYRDLKVCGITTHQHMQEKPYDVPHERARVVEDTLLARILEGHTSGKINTIHHQGINMVAAPLVVNAWGEDGVAEGIESTKHPFFLGVQWHPEYLDNHAVIFQALAHACAQQ